MLARTHHADSQTPTALRLYQYQNGKSPAEVLIKIQLIFAFVYQITRWLRLSKSGQIMQLAVGTFIPNVVFSVPKSHNLNTIIIKNTT